MTAMMIEAALRGLLLAAMVGAGLRLARVTNVPVRKAAWTLVLLLSASMPLLMRWPALTGLGQRLAWVVPLHRSAAVQSAVRPDALPVVATAADDQKQDAAPTKTLALASTVIPTTDREPAVSVTPIPALRRGQWPPLSTALPLLYLAVSGALLLRLLWGLGAATWLWMRAEEVSPLVAPEPNVRVSGKIPSPVTIGSGIVLPAQYAEWGHAKLRVVLAHERSHVRQGDFYLQLFAGVYTAFFWFSPLGWWLKRTLSSLGEAISDRAGIEAAASRSDYAGVLLEFAATGRQTLPGVAMARSGNLSRRVESLLNENLFRKAFAEGRRRATVALLVVPAALFVATALVRVPNAAAQNTVPSPPPATVPPDAAPAATPKVGPDSAETLDRKVQGDSALDAGSADQKVVPEQKTTPAPAPPQKPENPDDWSDSEMPMVLDLGPLPNVKIPKIDIPNLKIVMPNIPNVPVTIGSLSTLVGPDENFFLMPHGATNGYAYSFSSNGDSWAIVDGAGQHFAMGDGTTKEQLDLAQRMAKGPFLWFTREGKSYIVDDPAIVARIRTLCDPMKQMGQQQEELGVQQRVLGRMQGELARSMRSDSTVRVPDLSKEMADAEAALANLKSQQGQMLSEEKVAEMETKLAEVERKLTQLQVSAAMQNNVGEKMRALGDQQRQLGEQQRQLGDQQKKLADRAQQQVDSIIQECLKNGKATQVK